MVFKRKVNNNNSLTAEDAVKNEKKSNFF